MNRKKITIASISIAGYIAVAAAMTTAASTNNDSEGGGQIGAIARGALLARAQPANPAKVVSADACVKCHAPEIEVWKKTPHAMTYEELHRLPEAKAIAEKLGIRSIKYDNRCVACHYTQKLEQSQPLVIAGISCESCHGAAADWVDIHHNYGEGVTRQTESASHREQRVSSAIAAGMRNPKNVYLIAQSCYRCHTVQDEELVNVGGHSVGSLDFELVSWMEGTLRHNFVRSEGKVNDPSDQARLRLMFVAGMLAEFEASLRATAVATEAKEFGINAAKRTARAASRLQSVAGKVEIPQVQQAVEIYGKIKLRVGNGAQLMAAADLIAKLGTEFAEQNNGTELEALDAFIPPMERWK